MREMEQLAAEAYVYGYPLVASLERGEQYTTQGGAPKENNWRLGYHSFDYNLDHFEIGTRTDSRWGMRDRVQARKTRAAAARAGLSGNHGYEAAYAMTWLDKNGTALDGTRAHTLRFETIPPVRAFWSITMYSLPDYYLVDNAIDRYSIGDRTRGLVYGDDGSLTLYLRPDEPTDPEQRANWLPTPPGPFRPILRMYEPRDVVFDGAFTVPPITPAS